MKNLPSSTVIMVFQTGFLGSLSKTGWWFQRFQTFSPLFGEDEPILTCAYFADGWEKTTNQKGYDEKSSRQKVKRKLEVEIQLGG